MKSILLHFLLDSKIFLRNQPYILAVIPHPNKKEVNWKENSRIFMYTEIKQCKFSVYNWIALVTSKYVLNNGVQYSFPNVLQKL